MDVPSLSTPFDCCAKGSFDLSVGSLEGSRRKRSLAQLLVMTSRKRHEVPWGCRLLLSFTTAAQDAPLLFFSFSFSVKNLETKVLAENRTHVSLII